MTPPHQTFLCLGPFWGPFIDEPILDCCPYIRESGLYQVGDTYCMLLAKIWNASRQVNEKKNNLRVLPPNLREHLWAGDTTPIYEHNLPPILRTHVLTLSSYLDCEVNPFQENMIIEPLNLSSGNRMDTENVAETEQPFETKPVIRPTMEENSQKEHKGIARQNSSSSSSSSDNDKKSAYSKRSTIRNIVKGAIKKKQPNKVKTPPPQGASNLQEAVRKEVTEALEEKQQILATYPGSTYRHSRRGFITSILQSPVFANLSHILEKFRSGTNLSEREIAKLETSKQRPIIEQERQDLNSEQIEYKLVNPQSHFNEVTEDQWAEGQPMCGTCLLHHTTDGTCLPITPGLPALAASNARQISASQLDQYDAIYFSIDPSTQILGPQLKTRMLNLSPTPYQATGQQFMKHDPSEFVQASSKSYAYEYELTSQLLKLLHKIDGSQIPVFIVPHFSGSLTVRSNQAQASATAITNAQALYCGALITLCPVTTYSAHTPMASYLEEKKLNRIVGDMLTAHLAAQGQAALTIEVAALPVDTRDGFAVHKDWNILEPLFTTSGYKRREFYKRHSAALDKKAQNVLKNHINLDLIKAMKAHLTSWDPQDIFYSDTPDTSAE